MAKIKYPDDWLGAESLGVIINYAELTKLCKANGLDAGHLSYIIDRLDNTALSLIDRMLEDKDNG